MKGKPLGSQAQQLVCNLLQYFQQEKDKGGPNIPLSSIQERVADALNISMSTVTIVRRRLVANNNIIKSPGKKRPRPKSKTLDLSDSTKSDIRDTIYHMYSEKKHITLVTLKQELEEKSVISISKSSLQRILLDIGFKFKKDDNRRYLIEKVSVAVQRSKFLRTYVRNLQTKYHQVVFLDETWIFSKGNPRKSWQDSSIKSVRRPLGFEGKIFIVVHAGTEKGFVQNASLVFSSKNKNSDYHGEMNNELFLKWLDNKLLCNLEEPSLIIMDNALYHSVLSEKNPHMSFKKEQIIEWLEKNNIDFERSLTKIELLQIAKNNAKEKKYVVDEKIRSHGHEVLRTPPYQCEFNAIELIWANAKQYYDKHIGRHGHSDEQVLAVWNEALNQVTPENWKQCINHTNKIILDWYEKTVIREVEPLIINVDSEDDSDSDLSE